jgi:hypothetical protein
MRKDFRKLATIKRWHLKQKISSMGGVLPFPRDLPNQNQNIAVASSHKRITLRIRAMLKIPSGTR